MNRMNPHKIQKNIFELPLSGIELLLHLSENLPLVSLGLGEPNFDTPSHIIQAGHEALDDGETHYSPDPGLLELREAIAEKTERENRFVVNPDDEVLVTPGTSPAIFGAIHSLIEPSDEVIIPTPSYFAYDSIVRIFGGKSIFVSTQEKNEFIPETESLKEAISPKTKLIVICSPNNPNGTVWNRESLNTAIDLAEDHDFLILSDELYEKIVFDGVKNLSPAAIDNAFERTITVNGLSKGYAMTGFRIGWIIAPSDIISSIRKIHQYSTICAPVVSQRAAIAALTGPQECIADMVTEYDRRRQLMMNRFEHDLPLMHPVKPKGSFFMFVNIQQFIEQYKNTMKDTLKTQGKEVLNSIPQDLLSHRDIDDSGSILTMLYFAIIAKVLTASGSYFGPGGEGYLRVSFAQTYELINTGIDRLVETLSKLE